MSVVSLPLAKWSSSLGLDGYMPIKSERPMAVWPINSRLRRAVSMIRLKKSGADLFQNPEFQNEELQNEELQNEQLTPDQTEEEDHG